MDTNSSVGRAWVGGAGWRGTRGTSVTHGHKQIGEGLGGRGWVVVGGHGGHL